MKRGLQIAVIGAGDASADLLELARAIGRELAARGATLVCGGRGGVMEAAAHGARERGGHTIGIIPSFDHGQANPHIEFVIATGMGEARNAIVAGSADAVIAMAGEGGTLSEIGFALKLGRPIVAIRAWPHIDGIAARADEPAEAAAEAIRLALARDHYQGPR
ncbi:MAG TPA: TIGR00725 family protein [Candidatus Binataceae bacterium]|nr:TIGR00725 family protein [Candidatus Binataceae bacterium]HVA69362.1 TIGR00725 family protein [Candidatus Binataceae bacterium]